MPEAAHRFSLRRSCSTCSNRTATPGCASKDRLKHKQECFPSEIRRQNINRRLTSISRNLNGECEIKCSFKTGEFPRKDTAPRGRKWKVESFKRSKSSNFWSRTILFSLFFFLFSFLLWKMEEDID
jgi:hypothetical protein